MAAEDICDRGGGGGALNTKIIMFMNFFQTRDNDYFNHSILVIIISKPITTAWKVKQWWHQDKAKLVHDTACTQRQNR